VPPDGEVWADDVLKSDGVEVGMELLLGPARSPVTVAGFVSNVSYSGQGSLWGSADTWRMTLSANRPDAQLAEGVYQALIVVGDGSRSAGELVDAIDTGTNGATEAFTVPDAVNAIPGVEEQQGVFNQIIGVTVVIALVVIALFFALLTVERTSLYGVLKALGATSRTIFAGLISQAVAVTLIASIVAGGMVLILDRVIPPGAVPLDVTTSRIVTSVVLLVVAAVIGCAFSLRRVLRIDPASAIGSSA
jgi:putative ABC transport system permease protein